MKPLDLNLDWSRWFNRWEAMQRCYIPQRLYRFDLMFRLAELPRESRVQILDLGCGPGSLSFRALQHYPNAQVVAVDSDPILLTIGQRLAQEMVAPIQFAQADIRQADRWAAYEGTFDLVVSATALHWLNAEHLAQTYRRIYRVLKPDGTFFNSDHVASDDPRMQARYRYMLREKQQEAFHALAVDDWDGFWQALGRESGQADLLAQCNEAECWEGSDDGLPKSFHLATLRDCGFEQVEFHWQDLGEAVYGASK